MTRIEEREKLLKIQKAIDPMWEFIKGQIAMNPQRFDMFSIDQMRAKVLDELIKI